MNLGIALMCFISDEEQGNIFYIAPLSRLHDRLGKPETRHADHLGFGRRESTAGPNLRMGLMYDEKTAINPQSK